LLKLEAMGYRTAQGRFSKRTDELAAQMRNETRDLSRSMVSTLEYYAPKDKGIFAEGIRFRTVWKGDRVESTIYVSGKHAFLLPFLVEGTQPHEIPIGGAEAQKAKGYPLHWIDKAGGHHYAWSVWHPGTFPDPFIALAMDAMSPQFIMGLGRVARRVAWLA
jgi:hypothetical protein